AAARGRAITDVVPDWGLLAERISVMEEAAPTPPQTLPLNVNGRQLWLSFVAVRSPDGVVFAFRDLTGERRLDDEKRDLVATMSPQLPPDCPVSFDAEPDLPPARGDRDRVQQVLVNLLDNAVKYGRPPLAVSLETRTSVVSIAVADSGPGIPHVEQERIFEKFY